MGFFWHKGFSESAFRASMISNLKSKRFARGGSTISMQLVKNVFLTRNKTVARKLEEVLIVWLIENNALCPKSRMYEVYLNIIEWGPMVYGANEASQFYFAKDASQLTLNESIFLASIVPKPKWFRSSFDANGNLKPSLGGFYLNIASRLLNNGLITQEDFNGVAPNIILNGPAKNLVLLSDSITSDSLILPDDFDN
jgi:membrane peptidoglycan carboxypeptidase